MPNEHNFADGNILGFHGFKKYPFPSKGLRGLRDADTRSARMFHDWRSPHVCEIATPSIPRHDPEHVLQSGEEVLKVDFDLTKPVQVDPIRAS
jgi:hypothetical protein